MSDDSLDRRWPIRNRDGVSRVVDVATMPRAQPKAPRAQPVDLSRWEILDPDQPAGPLPERWKGWLTVTQ